MSDIYDTTMHALETKLICRDAEKQSDPRAISFAIVATVHVATHASP